MTASDAYSILGLREGAGEDEIKAAYRALAQKYDPQRYEAGPLREEAAAKMDTLNEAFDLLMGALRTGAAAERPAAGGAGADGRYAALRRQISSGAVDSALETLKNMPDGENDAEWNFLVGSAYYYKGWVADAMRFFEQACRLAPQNREYAAALRNLQSSARGAMPGSPYGDDAPDMHAVGCSCCDMCTTLMCMNMCCNCGRGGC